VLRVTRSILRRSTTTALLAGTVSAALAVTTVAPASAIVPRAPKFGATIERLASYQPQKTCSPHARPGVVKFRALILATYAGTGDSGIVRACSSGGTSEHKEGRAWDWHVSATNPRQVRQVKALFSWLFARDAHGNRYAMIRRLGIMYIIWNKRIWGAYRASDGWRPYSCSGVTDCHRDHVLFSFSWAGARAQTSFWAHQAAPTGGTAPSGGHTGGTAPSGGTTKPPAPSDPDLPATVGVPADVEVKRSAVVLRAGHHYRLTASGTYTYWTGYGHTLAADAECSESYDYHSGVSWVAVPPWSHDDSPTVLDLAANGRTGWRPVHDDGAGCDSEHRYVMRYTPTSDVRLSLSVLDWHRDDNAGRLQVTVRAA
jgi:hypothetical protein